MEVRAEGVVEALRKLSQTTSSLRDTLCLTGCGLWRVGLKRSALHDLASDVNWKWYVFEILNRVQAV